MKLCSRCKINPSPRSEDPKANSFCKPCQKAYSHEHYLANKADYIASAAAQRAKDPEKVRLASVAATQRWRQKKGREYTLKSRYELTVEQFEEMAAVQGGCCAICGDRPKRLHADHDHETGAVRGLLCFKCNAAIGLLRDSPDLLLNAVDYLEKPIRLRAVR